MKATIRIEDKKTFEALVKFLNTRHIYVQILREKTPKNHSVTKSAVTGKIWIS